MSDQLLDQIMMDCPICNKKHNVEKRLRQTQALFKGEIIHYEEQYFLCSETEEEENEFVPAKIMDENLLGVRDAYRTKHGLLTSKEIAAIRGVYSLTQSEFAALLGWGEITVTRYESKTIQDETYDNLMRMIYDNPMMALEYLEKHSERFRPEKYELVKKSIFERLNQDGNLYFKIQEIKSLYMKYHELNDANGYKLIDIEKLGNVMAYFAEKTNNLFKVKLMKLLWYADALYFRRHSKSMTGLIYEHMTYGALPIGFNEILDLPTIKVIEEMIYEDISYRIQPQKEVRKEMFSAEEWDVLELVARKFKGFKAREIVDYMHEEKAYLETVDHQIIPYSLAKELKELF